MCCTNCNVVKDRIAPVNENPKIIYKLGGAWCPLGPILSKPQIKYSKLSKYIYDSSSRSGYLIRIICPILATSWKKIVTFRDCSATRSCLLKMTPAKLIFFRGGQMGSAGYGGRGGSVSEARRVLTSYTPPPCGGL